MRTQTPATAPPGFEDFAETARSRLRTALSAHYGTEIGADAAAEALAYAWEHWPRVGLMANPVGYLYRVGQSAAQSELRRGRRPALPPVPPALIDAVDPELPRALLELSPQQRAAVLLVHAHGWTLTEAAEALSVGVSTLRNHLARGLDRLRRTLGDTDA
jgi:RNA polymerase sigma-70 factor (ECF subfamily)